MHPEEKGIFLGELCEFGVCTETVLGKIFREA
jgi:hypothetical protein